MDLEALKLILETVEGVGDTGAWVAGAYILYLALSAALIAGSLLYALAKILSTVLGIFRATQNDAVQRRAAYIAQHGIDPDTVEAIDDISMDTAKPSLITLLNRVAQEDNSRYFHPKHVAQLQTAWDEYQNTKSAKTKTDAH